MPRTVRNTRSLFILLLLLVAAPVARAQQADTPRALSIQEYERWRSIRSARISDDGAWVTWVYTRPQQDDSLHVRRVEGSVSYDAARGSDPSFSEDGRWLAYQTSVPFEEGRKLRIDRKPVPTAVELLDLRSGEKRTWEGASSFGFSAGSRMLAVRMTRPQGESETEGWDLLLVHLDSGAQELLGSVSSYAFNKPGTHLAYTVDARNRAGNGLYLLDLAAGTRRPMDSSGARYARLTWDEEGTAIAVLRGDEVEGKTHRANAVIAFTGIGSRQPERFEYDPRSATGFPESFVISERGTLDWDEGSTRLFLGVKVQEEKPEERDKYAEPLADVDIFHWQDDRIQSVQRSQADRDRNRTYRAVFLLARSRVNVLTDEKMRSLQVTRDGRWGIGEDETPYVSDWKESQSDIYRVDVDTGRRTLVLKGQKRTMGLSPDGRHFLYWKGGDVWAYEIAPDRHRNLTDSAPVDFADMEWDYVGERPPYGTAGWTEDGRGVILEHRYDLWLQPLDGSPATNLTQRVGEDTETVLRIVRLDPEERFVDLSRPVLLSAYGQWTKQEGYYRLENGHIRLLVKEDRHFGRPVKAKGADRLLYTRETFAEYPDYWVSGPEFRSPQKMTDADPWQSEYRWGHRILFDFQNDDGVRLQGTLAIPDGYRPGERLPMLVNFYEKNSQNLHRYQAPSHASRPNFAGYVSAGYLVMQPDIHFRTGTSHSDMLECVEAAVRKVIEMGYADPDRVGLHGHSYSGGGASYIATRSKMFAAIVAGAAPINLAGEFNIIFRGSGQNNHQYDIHGQGRYGTDPFTDFELYRQQSPITWVETMDTPLIYLHGTEDPTVEYNQGLEFYNALRFLGKPVIFLSYPGEGHGLRRRENQIDFQTRIRQFYDRYLKDVAAPEWILEGRPFLKKPG